MPPQQKQNTKIADNESKVAEDVDFVLRGDYELFCQVQCESKMTGKYKLLFLFFLKGHIFC